MDTQCGNDMSNMKESGLRIRVEQQLRHEFIETCKRHDLTASQVLRAFMRSYIEKNQSEEQLNLFNDSDALINGKNR